MFEHLFAINDVWLYPFDGIQEEPVPVAGYNLKGEPVRQGFSAVTLTWSFMKQQHFTALWDAYDPTTPRVKLTIIDKAVGIDKPTGDPRPSLIDLAAMMHEPVVGARQIVWYLNVAVRFSRFEPWS